MRRDGHSHWLPENVDAPNLRWSYRLPSLGLAGLSASKDFVVIAGRNATDDHDLFAALDPDTGIELWRIERPATGELDYGNSPRATPVIVDPYVYCLSAFGDLYCLNLDSGEVVWQKHLVRDLGGALPEWGFAGTPLIVGKKLIVGIGGDTHAIVALDAVSGDVIWRGAGKGIGYAAPLHVTMTTAPQVIAYESECLSGWDLESGKKLWSLIPEVPGDFNVPTPVLAGNTLILATENNATRQYGWDQANLLHSTPLAQNLSLVPDAHTPVATNDLLIGACGQLYGLDLNKDLKPRWTLRDPVFAKHCSLIASGNRLLCVGETGEVVLLKIDEEKPKVLGRFDALSGKGNILSHPAILHKMLLIRTPESVDAWTF